MKSPKSATNFTIGLKLLLIIAVRILTFILELYDLSVNIYFCESFAHIMKYIKESSTSHKSLNISI